MINLTTNTKSFSVEKGTAGGKSGGNGSGSTIKIIKQIINQGGGSGTGSGSGGSSYDVFTGATAYNPGRQGLVPQPLAGQNTLFLKGNGIWEKVFQFIREDEEGNIYIDGKATKFGSPIYLKDIFSNQQDLAENLRKIEIHDNVQFDKKTDFVGDVSVGGSSDFLGESRFSNNVIFNRNQANGSGPNKVTVNADLEVNGKSNFTDDMTATNITVDYLTVTKLAHFFELVIDKIRASQGQIIITAANAKIDYVEETPGVTRLYWRADSENQSNLSLNEFVEGDQIVCQTFNRGQMQKNDDGSYHGFNVSNKYYWVVCSGVGQGVEKTFPDSEGNPGEKHVYNFVEISVSTIESPRDGAFLPEIGDEIVQLGNRRDTLRQAAIIISAYNNAYLDKEIKAPAIVQYDGINDFKLYKHRLNVISKGLNRFMGSYLTGDGKTDIVDKIGNVETITNNKFSEIQQTIDGITQTVSNNKTSIENISSSIGGISSSIGGINDVIDNINSSIGGIKDNLGDLTIQVNTNTENISQLTQTAEQIQATVTQNKKSIATINSSIGTLSGKVTENTTNISQLTQRADSIQASVTQNSERIEQISGSVSGDLTGIINQVTTNTNNIAALKIKADNINSKVESNTTKIEKIGTDIGTANEKLDSMQTTITNNKSEIDQRADEISSIVSSHTEKIDNLTGKVTQNTTNISNIDQKADSIQSTVTRIEGDYVTSSKLTQTSTEILAQVSNTYIKIDDDNITLGGNTTVKGSLTLTQTDQGFKLVGSDGVTEIMPKSVGTYDEFKSSNTSTQNVVKSVNCNGSQTISDGILRFEGAIIIYLGDRKKGDFIKVRFNTFESKVTNGWTGSSFTNSFDISNQFSAKVMNQYNSAVIHNWNTVQAGSEYSYTFDSNTTNARIYVTFKGNTLYSTWIGNYGGNQGGKPIPTPNAHVQLTGTVTLPTTAHMLIGYDGWGVNFGNNKTVYCGKDGFIACYGNNEFRITSEGISHNNMATTHTIIGSSSSSSPAIYEVQDPVDLVLCKSGYCKIRMPKTPYNGQTIKVLDKSPDETWIDFNGKYVCPADGRYESRSLNSNWACNGTYPRLFTYLDNTWYEEYMG